MYRATKDIILPTTITGSLPRPSWYTENLGTRHFLEAMVSRRFREQYEDALTCFIRDQELAGLDIVTDGDCRFDDDVGGQSWTSYPPNHMSGFDQDNPLPTPAGRGGVWFPRGHILHDYLESRVMPPIVGPVGRGNLQYTAMWKAAQRFTERPVKFGAVSAEIVSFAVQDRHYKSVPDRMFAIAEALQRGISRARRRRLPGDPDRGAADPPDRGAQHPGRRDQSQADGRGVQPHRRRACAPRPRCGRIRAGAIRRRSACSRTVQTYKPALEAYNTVDADVITFESSSSGGIDLEAIGKIITEKKISHRRDRPPHACRSSGRRRSRRRSARALKHIPAERLMISTDCGMGREGMSRRHAFYKAVSIVLGTNIVRKELGVPEAQGARRRRALFAGGAAEVTALRSSRHASAATSARSGTRLDRRTGSGSAAHRYALRRARDTSRRGWYKFAA